jgi:hypothetical protein
VKVSAVPKEHVLAVWPQAEPYVKLATDLTCGRFEPEDVLDQLIDDKYLLWIAFDGTDVKGAVVTTIIHYPRKRYLYLMFCGGEDGFAWKEEMLKVLRCWAYDNQCDGIEANGRLGWAKIFKADGYKSLWQLFELPAGEAGIGAQYV